MTFASKNIAYITRAVEREAKKALASGSKDSTATRRSLEQENRKLQNLLAALEGGAPAPSSVLKAIADRERTIAQLEREPEAVPNRPPKAEVGDLTRWVKDQLSDLATLLREDVPRVKTEFRRLNLALKFTPVEAEPRAHYVVEGQCDLSALVFSFVQRGAGGVERGRRMWQPRHQGAVLDPSGEGAVHSRTPVLLRFAAELPSVEARGRWRERGRMGRRR